MVPSPDRGWYTKCIPSAVDASPGPAPATVNVPFAKLALPDIPTDPMSPSNQPAGRIVTVNEGLFTAMPFTVTENGPDDAPTGTMPVMPVLLQFTTGTVVPLSAIVLVPCVAPNCWCCRRSIECHRA